MEILQEVPEPLTQCDHCGIHMPVARLIKHMYKARCEKAIEIRLMQRDVKME